MKLPDPFIFESRDFSIEIYDAVSPGVTDERVV